MSGTTSGIGAAANAHHRLHLLPHQCKPHCGHRPASRRALLLALLSVLIAAHTPRRLPRASRDGPQPPSLISRTNAIRTPFGASFITPERSGLPVVSGARLICIPMRNQRHGTSGVCRIERMLLSIHDRSHPRADKAAHVLHRYTDVCSRVAGCITAYYGEVPFWVLLALVRPFRRRRDSGQDHDHGSGRDTFRPGSR